MRRTAALPRWRVEGGEVVLLDTVQGLVAERARVERAFHRVEPAAVALGISPEDAGSLLRYERDPEVDHFEDLMDHDYVYGVKLREYGEVDLPPPDLLEAARLAKAHGVPLHGIDLTEDQYETLFTKTVSTLGFLKYGRIQRRLAAKPPRAADARAFALAWDARLRKVRGIARVEAAREAHMAEALPALAQETGGRVLAVVDLPRAVGVRARLADAWGEPEERAWE